ncbi:hypothetical protein BDN71DRAFT_713381 [Pleurotus eryngii]|uniref:Uncharacterized protein n=1 Tax=Pleurotus eryngii TaxID=5323 RepID=A0A9P6DK75_PLEER|nr:hypothetical protein BDN71DRAFT_713381 [Pleurotus eryngii]
MNIAQGFADFDAAAPCLEGPSRTITPVIIYGYSDNILPSSSMATPMSWGKTPGPLVIVNCVNSLSYTFELVMAYVYFRNYQEDKKLMKLAVAALLLVGLVSVVSYITCTYLVIRNTFYVFMTHDPRTNLTYSHGSSNNYIALILAVLAMLSFVDSLVP